MKPIIRIVGDERIVMKFKAAPDSVRGSLLEYIGRAVLRLRAYVSSNKLAGQVLKMRTGTLTRSVDTVVMQNPSEVTGVVGTNVEYARRHEYGMNGPESVKAHLRLVKQAFGKDLKTPVWSNVAAFTRQVKYPERSFLRSSLREMEDSLVTGMIKAANKGLQ